jgi:hypothetical protein
MREALLDLRIAVVNPSQRWKARGIVEVMREGRWGVGRLSAASATARQA